MKTAVYGGTRNIYRDMIPSIKSLIHHSDVERIWLMIEDDLFPYELPDIVKTINVSNQRWVKHTSPNWNKKWSWMVLMKSIIPKILPECNTVLWLDYDAIVIRPIGSELWDIDLTGYYFAGAVEPYKSVHEPYINIGVTVMNLELLRAGMDEKIIDALNDYDYEFCEQDCINQLCGDMVLEIDSEYNCCHFTKACIKPKILHFAGIQGWQNLPAIKRISDIPWSAL